MHKMGWLHGYVFKGFLIVLIQESIASKNEKVYLNVEWNQDQYPKDKSSKSLDLTLECEKNYQLFDITVVAGTQLMDEDFNSVSVFGYTPSLIVNTNLCYWNRACIISFPRDVMFSCVSLINDTDNSALVKPNEEFYGASCFLQNVEFLRPIHAKCVQDKLVTNIFELNNGKVMSASKLPRRKGLIKSHKTFPWNYHEVYQSHSFRYKFRLRKKKNILMFGLKFVHVCDGDSLIFKTKKDDNIDIALLDENTHMNFTKNPHRYVELEFKISPYSEGCGGFLICYKVIKKERLHKYGGGKGNVCDDFIKRIPELDKRNE